MYLPSSHHWLTACTLEHQSVILYSTLKFHHSQTDNTTLTSMIAASLPQALPLPVPLFLSIHGWDGRQSRQPCHRSVWTEWQTPDPRVVCGRVGAAVALQRLPEEASVCRSSDCRGWSLAPSCPQLEETGLGPALPAARQLQQLHWQQQNTAWWWWAQQIPPLSHTLTQSERERTMNYPVVSVYRWKR